MKKSKRFLLSVVITGIALTSLGVAAWLLNFEGSQGYLILSDEPVLFSDTFTTDITLDTTNSSKSDMRSVSIINVDSDRNLTSGIATNVVDETGDCCDPENDLSVSCKYDGSPVNCNGTIISSAGQTQNFNVTSEFMDMSCPANYSIVLTMIETE